MVRKSESFQVSESGRTCDDEGAGREKVRECLYTRVYSPSQLAIIAYPRHIYSLIL